MQPLPELIEACRRAGMRITPQRLAIFECLREQRGHLSAEEVFQSVRERHPTLSFATVYNTLEMLTRMGQVREVIVDELRRRYDVNTDRHHHAVCRNCHRIVDVMVVEPGGEDRVEVDLSPYDFAVESVSVEYSGLCGECLRGANGGCLAETTSPLSGRAPRSR